MSLVRCPGPHIALTQRRIPKKLRHPLAHPQRQMLEIQKQQRVRIFVIDGMKRRRAFAIQPQHHVILLAVAVKQPRWPHPSVALPFIRRDHLHRGLVPRRQNHDRLRRIHPKLRKRRMKDPAHPLELQRNPPRLRLPGITGHHKVPAPHLHPGVRRLIDRLP